MQLQMTANLEDLLRYETPVPHELKTFFKMRNITTKAIAKSLNCSAVAVRTWLNGNEKPSVKREGQLQDLKKVILRWELKRGKMFNAKEV
jgi:hypothetical protein